MAQIGLMFEGQMGMTWRHWQRLLQAAEDLGYQCVFRSDHYTTGDDDDDSLETWVSLTYAASHTNRIEFGPLVSPVTFRHPSLLARMAAQVDDLSGGRLVLGMGAGWNEREHRQFGIPFYDVQTRFEMFEDALQMTHLLFESDESANFTGKHFSLDGAILLPRPERAGGPPILIGGNGKKRTLPLAATYADEWNGVFITPAGYAERTALLNDLLAENGRGVGRVKRSLMTQVIFGKDEADARAKIVAAGKSADELADWQVIAGTASQVVDRIGQYVEAGCERFMLQWLDLEDVDGIERMARDVLPQVSG